jgi:serine/threonine-protein kinase
VWRARHQLLARPCAIKLIRPELLGESKRDAATERFRLEARTIARLSSPNTVRLYDYGVSETGSFYFVMELLTGMDVASLVQRFGPLPPERAVAVLRQACRSLGEAHAAGVLHRDIKPHNLFLCRLGLEVDVLKVLDFGLVKSLDEGAAQLSTEGALTGTPAYMPPERVLGEPADERSEIYALGCVAYWMLTGRTVFTGEPMAVMIHHARTPPQPPSKVGGHPIPDRFEKIVLACLEKAPEKRPSSALELWSALGEVPLTTAWTTERAEAWWREHLSELLRPRP